MARSFNDILADVKKNPERYTVNYSPKTNHSREYENNYKAESFDELVKDVNRNPDKYKTNSKQTASIATDYANSKNSQVSRSAISSKTNAIAGGQSKFVPSNATKTEPLKPTNSTINEPKVVKSVNGSTAKTNVEEPKTTGEKVKDIAVLNASQYSDYRSAKAKMEAAEANTRNYDAIKDYENFAEKRKSMSEDELELLDAIYVASHSNDTSNAEGRMREQLKPLGYTDDEITRYSIYNKRYNNQKDSELWRESAKEYADEHPYLSSASTILPSVFGGVMGIADKASQLSDIASLKESGITPTFDTNGKLNYASQYSDAIRNRFMETHNDWTVSAGDRDFDVGDFVYSTTMSGLDSVTAMLVGDVAGAGLSALGMGETAVSLGKLGDIDFGVGSNLLGLGAANQTFNDTIDKGGSMSQAITSATLAGIAETFFEGVSIGNLKTFSKLESMPVDSVKAFVKKSLGSAFTNATEEGLTEVANITSDYLINGGVSDFYISWQNYINAGYPEDEAKSLAIKDLVYRIAEAAAGGALMGLGFGIGGGAMNAAQNAISDSYTGKQISKNGNPSGLLENIKETATEKKLSELADKYAARIAEGKKVSNRQLGAIERKSVESTMNAEMDSASFDEILQGVSSNERNVSQNREMAKIVQRYLDGETVSKNEENIIKTDPTISDYIQSRESAESEFNDQKKVKALNTIMAGAVKEKESEIKSSGTDNNVVSGKNAESIKIADIKRTGTNKGENVSITVEATVDGEKVSVPIEEVEFANSKAADVVNLVAGSTDLDTQTANYILKAAPMVKGSSATIIAHYMNYAYTAGRYNLSEDYIPTDATTILGKDIVEHLYKSGQNAKATLAESEIAKNVVKGKKVKNADVIRYEGKEMGVKRIEKDKTLTNVQKGSMIRGIALQKALGIEAVFYKSKKNADGKFVATIDGKEVVDALNGMYKNGKIYIDVNAGSLGEGTMLFTMSHELTHFIKQWSPAQFRKLADYVLPIVHTDTDINRLIDNEIEKSKKTSNPLTREVAEEEIVANALETMLSDDKDTVINNLIGLKNEDEGLFKKIVSKISKWADEIHRFYNEMLENGRLTSAGRAVAEMADDIDGLRDMFTEALKDAGKNFQSATVTKISDTLEGAKDTDGSPLFQYRAMEADEAKYKQMLVEYGDLSVKQIDNLFNMVDEVIDKVKKNLEILDYDWERDIDDRGFEPVKPNSDSLYRVSVDFSTLCRKRILQQAIQIQLQSALDRAITREESIAIRDELMKIQQEGKEIEIACALCYVESARMKSPAQIQNFLDDRRTIIKEFFANKDGGDTKQKKIDAEMSARKRLSKEHAKEIANGSMTDPMSYTFTKSGSKTYASLKSLPASVAKEIRDAKKEAVKSYKPTAEEAKLLDVADNMSTSDFTSPAGLENLAKNYRRLFDAYTSYVRNATKSKGLEKDTWWRAGDSIEKIPDSLIDAMNKENGLRSQSWSDFQVIHTLDYIAAVIELSTRNAKMQAYTKVPDYVKLMGLTNEMINLSLIPVTRFNGSLEFDSVEGMDFEKALELRKKYHSTAGTICIGIKDKQIQMLLDSALIDYVIPYHQSGMSKVLRKAMHIPTWTSYESFQNDKKLDRKEAIANAKKYNAKLLSESDANYHKALNFSDWFDYNEANAIVKKYQDSELELTDYEKQMKKKYGKMFGGYIAMQEMANKYKTMCAERGLAPKFSYCNSSDAKTDFSQEENYWKLLIDRKMVDSVSGEIIEQKAVQPIFKQSDVLEILDDEIARYPKVSEDQNYATRVVVQKFLSGEMNSQIEAIEKVTGAVKKATDNLTKVSILNSVADSNGTLTDRNDAVAKSSNRGEETEFSDPTMEDNAKYSIRDTEYLELAKDPVKNEAKLNEMVKQAAENAGYTVKLYHGTNRFGFTRVNTAFSDDGLSFFATSDEKLSYSYSKDNSLKTINENKYDAAKAEKLRRDIDVLLNDSIEAAQSTGLVGNSYTLEYRIENAAFSKVYRLQQNLNEFKRDLFEKETTGSIIWAFAEFCYGDDRTKWFKKVESDNELYDAMRNVASKMYDYAIASDRVGTYSLYAKPENLFEIDANGRNWNRIKVEGLIEGKKTATTRQVCEYASKNGYDGVLFKNIVDNGGKNSYTKASDVYAFFKPESQIKSADPITYDDSGNIVPLSERFNEKNDDIRYSTRVDNATYFSGRGNGYDGYSMSNNARSAYEDGEMPLSKWTKTAIIEAVAEVNPDIDVSGLNLETLKKNFLTQSSWHHTSKYYNKTNFWSISSSVKSLTQEDINSIKNIKSTKAKRDATLDDLIDDTYRKIQVIKASGLYKSDNGVLHQLSNADKFDSIYEKAVEILRSDIDKKVSQWRSLPEGHWRKDDVTAYDADPEGFILSYYSGRDNLSKNSTLFKKIGEAVSKRFNEDNKDTRFSVRDSLNAPSDIYAFYNNKIDESREMTMILNNLGENYASMLGKVVPDDKQIRKLTSEIIKQYNSKIDAKYLNDRIRATFDYMANTNILDWSQDIIPYLGQIGKEVLEQSAEIDDSLYNADFRKWMKKTTLKVSDEDVSERYKTFNEMRKSFFGKVNLSQTKGIPIDSLWNDMVNASDGYLPVQGAEGKDRDGDVVAANSTQNMFRILDGYFENTKKKVVNPYTKGTYDIDAVSINIGLDLYRKYWDVARHETPESRFANQMNRGYAELKDAKQKLREEIERQKKEVISNSKKTLKREIQSYRDTRENTRRRQVSKNDIERKVRYLQTRYEQKTNAKHIPKKYDELVSMMLKALPFNAPSMGGVVINSGRIAEMCNTYRVVSEAKGSAIEDMVEENISNLNSVAKNIDNNQIPFSRLSLSDYEAIGAVVDHIKFLVDNENKLFGENKKETIDAVSTRIRNELYENSELLKSKGKRVARDKGSNFFSKMLKPEYLFEESGSETLYKQYVAIRNGENKQGEILYKFRKYAQEQKAKYSYDPRWKDRIINNGDGIKNDRGQVMNLTIEETMSVYALSNRPQGLQHLLGGGIQIKREGKSTVPFKKITDTIDFRLTENDIQKIVNTLTSAQKQYADALVEYMSKDIAKDRNEVTMAIMGIEKYVENYYFPIESSKDAIADNVQRSERNSSVSNVGSSKTLNKNAMNKVIVNGFTDTVNNHIAESAVYCGFAVESENINRLWNSQTDDETKLLKSVIQENIGDARTRAMKQFMVDLNSGAAKANNLKFAEQFTSKMKKASVMANISVIVQQPTAVFRAMLYVDPKNFATTIHKADTEEMYRLNGCAMMKQIGYFDVNLGRTVTNWLDEYSVDKATKKDYSLAERWKQFNENGTLDELAGWGAEKADEVTWTLIWNACKKQCEGDLNKACELFQDTISKTQVYDSIFTKCELMRQKDLGSQMISAFMSEPVTSLNMLSKAIQDKSAGKVGGTVVARALTCYLGSLISNAMLKSLVQILRDDDDEKEFLVKYLTNIADNTAGDIFGMIPYLNSLYSILQGFSVERMDTEFFNAIVDGAKTIITEATSLTPDYEKMLSKALMGISQGVGIPVYNLYRDIKSIFVKGKKVLSGDKKTDNEKESPSNLPKEIAESIVDNFDFFNIGGKKINGKIKKYVAGDYSLRNEILDMADTSEITKSIGELYKGGRITQSTAKHALINLSYAKYEGDKNKRADSTIKGWDEKGKRKWKENVK